MAFRLLERIARILGLCIWALGAVGIGYGGALVIVFNVLYRPPRFVGGFSAGLPFFIVGGLLALLMLAFATVSVLLVINLTYSKSEDLPLFSKKTWCLAYLIAVGLLILGGAVADAYIPPEPLPAEQWPAEQP